MKKIIQSISNKTSESQEKAFQSHIANDKVRIMRVMCILGIILYLAFVVVDYWALPSAIDKALIIRGSFIVLLGISFGITYTKYFVKYYNFIVPIPYLLGAMGLVAMIFLAQPSEIASKTYFAGLMLIIMILFSWSHLGKYNLMVVTTTILSMYIFGEVNLHSPRSEADFFPIILTNVFFLVSAVIIGLVTHLVRDDYLRKNFLLTQSLQEAFAEKTIEADDYAYKANHDALTGLPNRRYITKQLEISLEEAKEKDKGLVILFIDLNGFKQINDIYGHAAGDEVLLIVAKRLELAVRRNDCLSRLGGDEYLIGFLIDKENQSEVKQMADNLTAIISAPMNVNGTRLKVGASVGIAAYPIHGNKVSVLMDIADKRMYQVKRGHHNLEKKKDFEPVVIFPGNKKHKQR